jgi:hypothetical protein
LKLIEKLFYEVLTKYCVGKNLSKTNKRLKMLVRNYAIDKHVDPEIIHKIEDFSETDVREVIHAIRLNSMDYPKFICAGNLGYWVEENSHDQMEYINSLRGRAESIDNIANSLETRMVGSTLWDVM